MGTLYPLRRKDKTTSECYLRLVQPSVPLEPASDGGDNSHVDFRFDSHKRTEEHRKRVVLHLGHSMPQ